MSVHQRLVLKSNRTGISHVRETVLRFPPTMPLPIRGKCYQRIPLAIFAWSTSPMAAFFELSGGHSYCPPNYQKINTIEVAGTPLEPGTVAPL